MFTRIPDKNLISQLENVVNPTPNRVKKVIAQMGRERADSAGPHCFSISQIVETKIGTVVPDHVRTLSQVGTGSRCQDKKLA